MSSLGRHILVEFLGCNTEIMNDVHLIEQNMLKAAQISGATVINSTFHHFSPLGVSGVIVIQESHLAIHTWPEYGYAAVDLFTCGDSVNPWTAFKFLKKSFSSNNFSAVEMRRGSIELLNDFHVKLHDVTIENKVKQITKFKRNVWITDRDDFQALSLKYTGDLLFDKKSKYHRIRVIDTYAYGKALISDNMILCTENDEYHYHEMMIHPTILTSRQIKKVLVIGGGDGGNVRQLIMHPDIELIDVVEIDETIIEASKTYLSFMANSMNDPKVSLIINDGDEFVKNTSDESYDLIIVDGPQPQNETETGLYSEKFFTHCKRVLSMNGKIIVQGASPKFNVKAFLNIHKTLSNIYKSKQTLLFNVPTYPSGIWSVQIGSNTEFDLSNINEELIQYFVTKNNLQYYNYSTHLASLALPEYVKNMLKE